MKITTLILLLIISQGLWAADFMLVMGAGGEPAKPDTIFDTSIQNLATYVKTKPELTVDVALDGGHPVTESIVEKEFPSNATKSKFHEQDYNRLIDKYLRMLASNEIKPGDQLLIYIDSHGAEKDGESSTHKISTADSAAENLNNLQGATLVDLDKLKAIRDLAKIRKVKLAIIDGSCHSGNTLALADSNTCVISSSGPNHYGYTSFTNNLTSSLSKGKNLEDIFLEIRPKETTLSFPMISTAEGEFVNNRLYEKLTPFLYGYDEKNEKLTNYLLTNNSEAQMCLSNQNYKALISMIDKIEDMNTVTTNLLWWSFKTKELDLSELKRLLAQYKSNLDEAAIKFRQLGTDRLKKMETIQVRAETPGFITEYSTNYSWNDLLTTDFDKMINETRDRISSTSDEMKKNEFAGMLDLYQKAKSKREEILRSNPDLESIKTRQAELVKTLKSSTEIASSIAKEERQLYQAMYKQAQKEGKKSKDISQNPCHNFTL